MIENAITKVKNCSLNDALALTYYLYALYKNRTDMSSHEECQALYFALVDRLDLGKHSEKVVNAVIDKHIKNKILKIVHPNESYRQPFDVKGSLNTNFYQDECIYDDCGQWSTRNIREINLVRAIFADGSNIFPKIVAMTFFINPEAFNYSDGKLPGTIPVSAKIKEACEDMESIKCISNILKLSKDEALILQVAYRLQGIIEMYLMNLHCADLPKISDYWRIG